MFFNKNEKIWKNEMHNKFMAWLIQQNILGCRLNIGLHHGEITFAVEFSTEYELALNLKNGVLKKIEEALIFIYNEVNSKNEYLKTSGYKLIEVLFKSQNDIGYILSNGTKN